MLTKLMTLLFTSSVLLLGASQWAMSAELILEPTCGILGPCPESPCAWVQKAPNPCVGTDGELYDVWALGAPCYYLCYDNS